jgi:hypothetical protein
LAKINLLQLQCLQNIWSSARLAITSRHTLIRDLHLAFRIPYLHDFIAKLRKQQTEVIQNHKKESFRNMLQKKYSLRGFNFAAVTHFWHEVQLIMPLYLLNLSIKRTER